MNRSERRRAAKLGKSTPQASFAGSSPPFGAPGDPNAAASNTFRAEQLVAQAEQQRQSGQLGDAAKLCGLALQIMPSSAPALHLAGLLSHETRDFEAAIELFTRATIVQPNNPQYQYCLGESYRALEHYENAEAAYRRTLELDDTVADAHYNLANMLLYRGAVKDAIASYQRAIDLKPDDAEYRLNLGNALAEKKDLLAALDSYDRALEIDPGFTPAAFNRGKTLRKLGRVSDAVATFERLREMHPQNAAVQVEVGITYQDMGLFDEALSNFEHAIELEPSNTHALYHLSHARKWKESAEILDRIDRLLAARDVDYKEQVDLHFAAAKIRDDVGEHDRAFEHYRKANELRGQKDPFDRSLLKTQIDGHIATFQSSLFERKKQAGIHTEIPIFIVGMPRSGTTLTEQILASHPQVHGAGELDAIDRMTGALPKAMHGQAPYPRCVSRANPALLHGFAEKHLDFLQSLADDAVRVTDKMPQNHRYLGLIALLFPMARIIHCRRDPIDTCLSCYFQNFASGQSFSWSLSDTGFFYQQYRRIMDHWRAVLPLEILEVDYEKLISNQEEESRRLVAFCGLDWDDRCLDFQDTDRQIKTASFWQVRQPIYKSSMHRWKRYESHLGPLIEALGV